MTLEAFYAKIGGNSADVLRRLPSEAMVRKFIGKYPADTSWGSLESAINSQDWEVAFRAAHTLKGVAQNLGFQKLYLSSTALTEALRGSKPLTDPALREAVAMDQAALLTAIQELEG
ncbi:MAG: Hpt domain-containing protein [Clostridiales bacterium]|nr:Hpt domain-containing protein [Clostridiales bacterium]